MSDRDTIFAAATAPGRAGVAIVRVSGAAAGVVVRALTGRAAPAPRSAVMRALRDPDRDELIDRGLVLWFPGPRSYTGEDVAEFHVHGGRAVLAALAQAIGRVPGVRFAEPGEFSRRAFLHGRLDLTQVEAIADLVDAETDAQRRMAQRQLEGELGRRYEQWRSELVRALAHVEATIDFVDEPLDPALGEAVRARVRVLEGEIRQHLGDGRVGERVREGLLIAIVGAPNVGKSSIINRLAEREVAIVAPTAGTTRDVIEVRLDIGGYAVTIVDTAGLRETQDDVEQEGVRRARRRAADADLTIVVFDATTWPRGEAAVRAMVDARSVVVINKADLARPTLNGEEIALSAVTGFGFERLVQVLRERVDQLMAVQGGAMPLTRERHRQALEDCVAALRASADHTEPELAAEELRVAAQCLGRITGRVDVEDLLDLIFRDFCIGK
ncbi:MAG: tRNA uridine-5-carboxymethylaminomethyl(34) synthesis GTPase MnmE [Alphaproteobacteria bacterium]|nr:tRNA uridine-5-carboxymethylaminomethyl(34) synthesis GTPase MnmE [Alphaproteobacteria bacterium]